LAPGGSSYPGTLTLFNGALYFSASTLTSANIFRSTTGSSTPVELIANASLSWLSSLTYANNSIYFLESDQSNLHRIDLASLTHTVTGLSGYTIPNYFWGEQGFLLGHGSKVYFPAYESATNNQVLLSGDEDLQNLSVLMPEASSVAHPFNAILSCGMADVFDFTIWNNKVIIPANFNDAGRELWIFEPAVVNAVAEVAGENAFTLCPNPASHSITIKTNGNGYCDQHQLKVVNMAGKIVWQQELIGSQNSIDLSLLPVGNYFATVIENGKSIGTKKLVLMK
jgi:hypothetical protein